MFREDTSLILGRYVESSMPKTCHSELPYIKRHLVTTGKQKNKNKKQKRGGSIAVQIKQVLHNS
jgi:hypothetical protein